jgi:hypothetical protein
MSAHPIGPIKIRLSRLYHRTYAQKCLSIQRPGTLQEVRARDRGLHAALQPGTAASRARLSQCAPTGSFPDLASVANASADGGS